MKSPVGGFRKTALAVIACITAAGVGQAAVFYATDVKIFVGKGDIQTACGFDNKKLQAFLTNSVANSGENWEVRSLKNVSYTATCEGDVWTGEFYLVATGTNKQGDPVYRKEKLMTTGTATIEAGKNVKTTKTATETIRKATQITGMWLNIEGVTEEVVGNSSMPKVGDACGQGQLQDGTITLVEKTGETYQVPEGVWVNCTLNTRNGDGSIINPGVFVGYTGVGLVISGT